MMELNQIRKKIKIGDKTHIAELVGCSLRMVHFVLNGERSSTTELGKKIIQAASLIIKQRIECL